MLLKLIFASLFFGFAQVSSMNESDTRNTIKGVSCDNIVSTLLDNFRRIMVTGSESLGIPVLSPYENDKINVDVTHEVGNATGYFANLKIEKLDTFETTHVNCRMVSFTKFHVEINMTVPVVNMTGDYDLNGFVIEIIPMFGAGPFSINITNLHMGLIANGKVVGPLKYRIDDLSVWMGMDETQMYFHNLLNGDEEYEELFNRMFSELGPIAVQDLWPDIEPIIVNKLLKAFNPNEI